jgi:hypothetical protein
MPGSQVHDKNHRGFTQGVSAILYPRLRELPPGERQRALERAREEAFDTLEIIGIALGMALVAWILSQPGVGTPPRPLPLFFIAHFVAAIPLLAAIVGPILLRRTRRGIEREIRRQRP